MKYLLFLFGGILLSGSIYAQTGSWKGTVYTEDNYSPLHFCRVIILPECDTFHTGMDASFHFDDLIPGFHSLKIYTVEYGFDEVKGIYIHENDTLEMDILHQPFCKYGRFWCKDDWGERNCPICQQRDQTIPVYYGIFHRQINPAELIRPEEKVEAYYVGGCCVEWCQPYWYCKRDELLY
ncbi:MAG: hypothetical protein AAF206_16440 [Bacteroidota bacterium]